MQLEVGDWVIQTRLNDVKVIGINDDLNSILVAKAETNHLVDDGLVNCLAHAVENGLCGCHYFLLKLECICVLVEYKV